jgi:hypothetical protein
MLLLAGAVLLAGAAAVEISTRPLFRALRFCSPFVACDAVN